MIDILVVFPKQEDARGIKNLLLRNGYHVTAVCTSGAAAMAILDDLDYAVIVCGYKFGDMLYSELYENLPDTIQMLLIASRMKLESGITEGVVSVEMPLKSYDLLETLGMMTQALERLKKKGRKTPKERNVAQKAIIDEAKKRLMDTRGMSEEEAHRYIQKNSMDSGNSMVETARMVLHIMN